MGSLLLISSCILEQQVMARKTGQTALDRGVGRHCNWPCDLSPVTHPCWKPCLSKSEWGDQRLPLFFPHYWHPAAILPLPIIVLPARIVLILLYENIKKYPNWMCSLEPEWPGIPYRVLWLEGGLCCKAKRDREVGCDKARVEVTHKEQGKYKGREGNKWKLFGKKRVPETKYYSWCEGEWKC